MYKSLGECSRLKTHLQQYHEKIVLDIIMRKIKAQIGLRFLAVWYDQAVCLLSFCAQFDCQSLKNEDRFSRNKFRDIYHAYKGSGLGFDDTKGSHKRY